MQVLADGSVKADDGRILYFSLPRFISDICRGDRCFICGAQRGEKGFNDEHVIPDWILRELNLHSRFIDLPNRSLRRYSQYRIPCCNDCNRMLGSKIEEPVSKIIKGGMTSLAEHLRSQGPWLIFIWMGLLFFKTHYKDRELFQHLDRREGTGKIADAYSWEDLHHLHCVIRSFYTHVELTPRALGSVFACQARTDSLFDPFDYGDSLPT